MAKGIVRKIDELGRIVLPKEYRRTLGLKEKDPVGMFIDGDVIHLVKADKGFIGIVRNLDELGRYTLPIEIRKSLGFEDNQKVDIYINYPNEICIRKDGCSWCGSSEDVLMISGHQLCKKCVLSVADAVMEG